MADMWVVVAPGTAAERRIPIDVRLHIGRECAGVEPARRLLLDQPSVSRDHAEIRVDATGPVLIDASSNGTRVNGRRVERGERVPLRDADVIAIGDAELVLRIVDATPRTGDTSPGTLLADDVIEAAVLVGDVIGYTSLTETRGPAIIAAATHALFGPLRTLVIAHGGVVNNYAGDAILATWERSVGPDAVGDAVRCALAAADAVAELSPGIDVRDAEDRPVRMGWAVTLGTVAVSHPSPGRDSVHGDAVNLAFRVAGLAGRDGRADVLVAAEAATASPDAATYGALEETGVKGRAALARVHPATAP